jgi:hypothetical protein
MAATHHARMSKMAAKALRDGAAGALVDPWYMAAGCSPVTQPHTHYLARVALSSDMSRRKKYGYNWRILDLFKGIHFVNYLIV